METTKYSAKYPILERIAASLLGVIMGAVMTAILLGVYALADLVL